MVELDALTHLWRLLLTDAHGAERRDISGRTYITPLSSTLRNEVATEPTLTLWGLPGCEPKSKEMAFALYYRQVPQQQSVVPELTQRIVRCYPLPTL